MLTRREVVLWLCSAEGCGTYNILSCPRPYYNRADARIATIFVRCRDCSCRMAGVGLNVRRQRDEHRSARMLEAPGGIADFSWGRAVGPVQPAAEVVPA